MLVQPFQAQARGGVAAGTEGQARIDDEYLAVADLSFDSVPAQANKITHKITQTEERINIQSGLGRCHLELAMKSKNKYEADKLFGNAVKHYQECLRLAKIYGKNSIQQQNDAQFWLGRCYFEHAKKTKDTDKAGKLFELAVEHYQEWLQLAKN